jgi:hypothetical protein
MFGSESHFVLDSLLLLFWMCEIRLEIRMDPDIHPIGIYLQVHVLYSRRTTASPTIDDFI